MGQRRADVGILAGAAVTSPSSCLHGCKTVAAPSPSMASTQEGGPCKVRKPAEREGLFQKPFPDMHVLSAVLGPVARPSCREGWDMGVFRKELMPWTKSEPW